MTYYPNMTPYERRELEAHKLAMDAQVQGLTTAAYWRTLPAARAGRGDRRCIRCRLNRVVHPMSLCQDCYARTGVRKESK